MTRFLSSLHVHMLPAQATKESDEIKHRETVNTIFGSRDKSARTLFLVWMLTPVPFIVEFVADLAIDIHKAAQESPSPTFAPTLAPSTA